ncbi:LPXTG cell wall anchor domain-containing protein [Amycolatopsis sp. GM8]|uniref:LPXTG cell wall anchor domain-containing protein n=1 Tax=Amycolatopsis sp. GM8 TaxID=2896530 RepID=UPI001F0059AF|nr:LPXTG cell wall anchor domain-containing protein [Amycolatopsis sp. GM8]
MRNRTLTLTLLGLVAAAGTMIGVAQAAVPQATLGSLTISDNDKTGFDVSAPHYTTAAGCPADADAYNMFIYGPGDFAGGLIATTTSDVGLAHDGGFVIYQGLSFKDIALDHQTTIQPGRYDMVANCLDSFSQQVKGSFSMPLWFTEPTKYTTTDPAGGSTTTTTPTTGTTTTGTSSSTETTETSSSSESSSSTTESTTISTTDSEFGALPTDTQSAPPNTPAGDVSPAADGKLANTGVPAGYLALAGVVLLGAGILLVVFTRRRRETVMSQWPE